MLLVDQINHCCFDPQFKSKYHICVLNISKSNKSEYLKGSQVAMVAKRTVVVLLYRIKNLLVYISSGYNITHSILILIREFGQTYLLAKLITYDL